MKEIVVLIALIVGQDCRNITMSVSPPLDHNNHILGFEETPQFVMITFDDAVTVTNFNTYKQFYDRKNKQNECPVTATFFLSHENTNYKLVHELYQMGHEIASHTITHQSNTQYWKNADKTTLINEIYGMRKMTSRYADIDINHITGFRAPFLQTTGNLTFEVLKETGFKYDSSMPTLSHSKPKPIFPYTLDNGYQQDCVIAPCPTSHDIYKGLYVVPMVDYWKKRLVIDDPPTYSDSPCSMADFCLPYPETPEDTFDYFKNNFDRHYKTNKAPFPIFLHYAWLSSEPKRNQGFFEFIDYLTSLNDVFLVNIQEVLNWMENPVPLSKYEQKNCVRNIPKSKCMENSHKCEYYKVHEFHSTDKSMVICGSNCPEHYPWLNNNLGEGFL